MTAVNIEIPVNTEKQPSPNIRTLNPGQLPGLMGTYALHGTAAVLGEALDLGGRANYDAVQFKAGPFSSFVVGSYALARLMVPKLEARIRLDNSDTPEVKSVGQHYGFHEESGEPSLGTVSLPWTGTEDGSWSDRRAFWRDAMSMEYDPGQIGDEIDNLIAMLKDDSNGLDIKHLAFAEVVQQLLGTALGSDINLEESAAIAETLILSDQSVTESMLTGFRFSPKGRYTRRYEAAKERTGEILEQRLLNGSSPYGSQLLELTDGSVPAAKTELLHMLSGSRGTGNSIYWGLKELYSDPTALAKVREDMSDGRIQQLTHRAISLHPGAPLAVRKPEHPLRVQFMDGDEQVGALYAGQRGRIILSSYAWGHNKNLKDAERGRAAFGIGHRRCPGEKIVLGVAPQIIKHVVSRYDLEFAESDLTGHGLSLSPRPNGRATISQNKLVPAQPI